MRIYGALGLLLHHVNKGFLQIVIKPPGRVRGAKKTTTSFVAIFMVVNTNHYEELASSHIELPGKKWCQSINREKNQGMSLLYYDLWSRSLDHHLVMPSKINGFERPLIIRWQLHPGTLLNRQGLMIRKDHHHHPTIENLISWLSTQ